MTNTLQNTLHERMTELGYDQYPEFYNSDKIVFQQDGTHHMHTFNYLWQEYALEKYLELNDLCEEFNTVFHDEKSNTITDAQKEWLKAHDFLEIIDHDVNNEQLEIDFYPYLQWYFIKDQSNNHYLLVGLQKYNSQDFSWFKLLKYFQPSFSFSMSEFYIDKWL